MNREFYQAKAYADNVKAMRAMRRPLEVWPAERHLVKLADLPVLGETERREGPGAPNRTFFVKTDAQLQTYLEVRKKYARLGIDHYKDGGYVAIGEW